MTSLAIFCATIVLLYISAAQATPFYQDVTDNFDKLPKLESFEIDKLTAGEWYFQYTSLVNSNLTCGSGHGIRRENDLFLNLLLFNSVNKVYVSIPEDFKYDASKPGVFESVIGVTKHIVAADMNNWLYCIQTTKNEGKPEVLIIFATRERKLNKEANDAYKKTTAELATMNLVPKTMLKQSQKNCPPITDVVNL